MKIRSALLALTLLAVAAGCTSYQEEIDAWHAARLERLSAEDGWLTLVGLHPLHDGVNTVGSAADADVRLIDKAPARVGEIDARQGGLRFTAAGPGVRRADDETEVTTIELVPDAQGAPTVLEVGTLRFHVIFRNGAHYLRVKDRESLVRTGFTGIERFPVDKAWRVEARLMPYDEPHMISVPNALGHATEESCFGRLIFEIGGKTQTLLPTGDPAEGLFIVFADRSSGVDTYGAGRFLSTDPPDAQGRVILDFNKATNPPCAFTDFATCPRPPQGNTLDVYVEAGEKTWGTH